MVHVDAHELGTFFLFGHRANGVLGILFNEESTADTLRTATTEGGRT